MIKRTCRKNIT